MSSDVTGRIREETERTLTAARDLLKTQGWIRHHLAEDDHGNEVPLESERATCFCAIGSLVKARSTMGLIKSESYIRAKKLLEAAMPEEKRQESSYSSVTTYNDAVVENLESAIAWFDKAIELAKKEATGE